MCENRSTEGAGATEAGMRNSTVAMAKIKLFDRKNFVSLKMLCDRNSKPIRKLRIAIIRVASQKSVNRKIKFYVTK